jgi:hypothetical protein
MSSVTEFGTWSSTISDCGGTQNSKRYEKSTTRKNHWANEGEDKFGGGSTKIIFNEISSDARVARRWIADENNLLPLHLSGFQFHSLITSFVIYRERATKSKFTVELRLVLFKQLRFTIGSVFSTIHGHDHFMSHSSFLSLYVSEIFHISHSTVLKHLYEDLHFQSPSLPCVPHSVGPGNKRTTMPVCERDDSGRNSCGARWPASCRQRGWVVVFLTYFPCRMWNLTRDDVATKPKRDIHTKNPCLQWYGMHLDSMLSMNSWLAQQ